MAYLQLNWDGCMHVYWAFKLKVVQRQMWYILKYLPPDFNEYNTFMIVTYIIKRTIEVFWNTLCIFWEDTRVNIHQISIWRERYGSMSNQPDRLCYLGKCWFIVYPIYMHVRFYTHRQYSYGISFYMKCSIHQFTFVTLREVCMWPIRPWPHNHSTQTGH